MAKMYPPGVSPETNSPGEIELFKKLRNDPITKNWVVLHSLDISNHIHQRMGETDFVIIVPGKGVLCLEVKAVRSLKRQDGMWYLGQKPPEKRGPFKQASQAMHSLSNYVFERNSSLRSIVFESAVIFPYIDFDDDSPEWQPWQVIDKNDLQKHQIGKLIEYVLDSTRKHLANTPSATWFNPKTSFPIDSQVQNLVNILRPNFEFYESPESRKLRCQSELKKYTDEQFDALDSIQINPRVIFAGPAGTGKTLLAIELARRKSLEGKKVLLLCFNRLLAEWISTEVESLSVNVKAGTIHSIMLSVAGISPTEDDDFWKTQLAETATNLQKKNGTEYDVLIVDEAQDILTMNYLTFLEACVSGGLYGGNIYFFGDFENQVIYDNEPTEIIQAFLPHFIRFSLRVNCRNTPRISALVHLLGGLSPDYARVRRPDNNKDPEIILYSSKKDQREKLIHLANELINEKHYSGEEIILLSPHSDTKSIASKIGKPFRPLYALTSTDDIAFSSIYSFKGLESPIIIITDIDQFSTDHSISLFYTGITRAVEELYIFVHKETGKEILSTITSL